MEINLGGMGAAPLITSKAMLKNKISISQMCEELGVTRGTIYNKIKENNFTLEKIGKQSYLSLDNYKILKGDSVDEHNEHHSPICNVVQVEQVEELTPSKIDNYYANKISDLRFELQKENQEKQKAIAQSEQTQREYYNLSNDYTALQQRYAQLEQEYKQALEYLQAFNFIGNYHRIRNQQQQQNTF